MKSDLQPERPPLVLHICCAPDEAWVVHSLRESYVLHCFFCNPNISPESEYRLRLQEAREVAERYGVPFTEDPYEPDSWELAIAAVSTTPEGGDRCNRCFSLRLGRTARFTAETGIASFTSVMSVSPHKKIAMLNATGTAAAAAFGVEYLGFDFKKKDGFRRSIELSTALGLYRQDYCGCRLSRVERDRRRNKTAP